MPTEFATVRKETVRYRNNAFFEVERRRIIEGEKQSDFVMVTRGYFKRDGNPYRRSFVTLPEDAAIRRQIADLIAAV